MLFVCKKNQMNFSIGSYLSNRHGLEIQMSIQWWKKLWRKTLVNKEINYVANPPQGISIDKRKYLNLRV